MKTLIINSFRMIVYVAYFGIIAFQVAGAYRFRSEINAAIFDFTGNRLNAGAEAAVSIIAGLVYGWVLATLVCGLLVTLLDIRDDINDRLPDARKK
jgi:hypothetical protein